WCIEIVPVATSRIGASRSPVTRPISHHPSCHARTPRDAHVSAYARRLSAVRRGIAPSEWLTRYVQVSTMGNSRRNARRGSCIDMVLRVLKVLAVLTVLVLRLLRVLRGAR